jgi:hypothetical protein
MAGFTNLRADPPSGSATNQVPILKDSLEKIYSNYLESVEKEDAKLLLMVLPSARIADLKRALEMNGKKFPDDYFSVMKTYAPKMPPTGKFQFIATTESDKYANLIYVGNMNGYLRKDTDERRFLIIQFEKEKDGWKYAVVIDPPVNLSQILKRNFKPDSLISLSSDLSWLKKSNSILRNHRTVR